MVNADMMDNGYANNNVVSHFNQLIKNTLRKKCNCKLKEQGESPPKCLLLELKSPAQ